MPCNHLWGIHDAFAVPRARKSKPIEYLLWQTAGLTLTVLNYVHAVQAKKHNSWFTSYWALRNNLGEAVERGGSYSPPQTNWIQLRTSYIKSVCSPRLLNICFGAKMILTFKIMSLMGLALLRVAGLAFTLMTVVEICTHNKCMNQSKKTLLKVLKLKHKAHSLFTLAVAQNYQIRKLDQ
jgi:hypothetical protein